MSRRTKAGRGRRCARRRGLRQRSSQGRDQGTAPQQLRRRRCWCRSRRRGCAGQRREWRIIRVEGNLEKGTAEAILATFCPRRAIPKSLLVRAVIKFQPLVVGVGGNLSSSLD